jgi:hypothetical protein
MKYAAEGVRTARVLLGQLSTEIERCTTAGAIIGGEIETCEQALASLDMILGRSEGTLKESLALQQIALEQTEADEQAEFEAADLKIGGRSHGRN